MAATKTPPVKEAENKSTAKKVYKFKSSNKYLTVADYGIQFIKGEATTSNIEAAKALAKIDGVELIED